MKQVFEVEGTGGIITPEFIEALLRFYFQAIGYPLDDLTVNEVPSVGFQRHGEKGGKDD